MKLIFLDLTVSIYVLFLFSGKSCIELTFIGARLQKQGFATWIIRHSLCSLFPLFPGIVDPTNLSKIDISIYVQSCPQSHPYYEKLGKNIYIYIYIYFSLFFPTSTGFGTPDAECNDLINGRLHYNWANHDIHVHDRCVLLTIPLKALIHNLDMRMDRDNIITLS